MHQRISATGQTAAHKIVMTDRQTDTVQRTTAYGKRNPQQRFPGEPAPAQADWNRKDELLEAQCGEVPGFKTAGGPGFK